VFYGFDLDTQAGHRQDVSYQVWGSGSDRSAPVSLGLFYQDDSHKRWVLRCNDAKSLARLSEISRYRPRASKSRKVFPGEDLAFLICSSVRGILDLCGRLGATPR
jgi:hypothetical protein